MANKNILKIYKSIRIPWKFYFSSDGNEVFATMQKIFNKDGKDSCWELCKDKDITLFDTMTQLLEEVEREWKEGSD